LLIIQVSLNLTKITGISHDDQNMFLIISRCKLLTIGNVSDKSNRENRNTRFVLNNFFSYSHTVNGIMWENIVSAVMSSCIYIPLPEDEPSVCNM